MVIFKGNDFENALKWYKHIKDRVDRFNIKIAVLREKLALDFLNNERIDYFHSDYKAIVDNFETDFNQIINTCAVEQQYLPFMCMIIEEHADFIYDSTSFVLRVLLQNGFHEPQHIPTFGYEVYEAIGILNLGIEDVKEDNI